MSDSQQVPVLVAPRPYTVEVGPGLLSEVGPRLRQATPAGRATVVTDDIVAPRFARVVRESLSSAGFLASEVVVPAGETSKTWARAGLVLDAFAGAGLDRTDVVVALGGGVIGDLAGFAAAVFLRGIDLVQLPTTLLAQVDSSVGGKTGVDLDAGKNLAGAFKQPLFVLADTDTLSSLPQSEWSSGLAEVAKAGIIEGEDFLSWLEVSAEGLRSRQPSSIAEAVRRSVEFKARVVSADERESGLRECLNYGHTFGHAVEKVAGFGAVSHGIAVAEGIRFASRLAVDVIGAPVGFAHRQGHLLDVLEIPRIRLDLDPDALREAMSSDKKARSGLPRFVLADAPGSWRVTTVPDELLKRHIGDFVGVGASGEAGSDEEGLT
jgi:3-dehydroquinate synthase